jgi:hypothetical protein
MANGRLFACVLLLFLGSTLLATPAQSHEGDENSQGCHTDARTGEYHCHTPTKPQPQPRTEVSVTYCHVLYGRSNCGHTIGECGQLKLQYGGSCQQQMGFSAR